MMFAKLKNVREVLASVQMVNLEPATVDALREAIEELDDAMVMDTRAMEAARLGDWTHDFAPERFTERFALAQGELVS